MCVSRRLGKQLASVCVEKSRLAWVKHVCWQRYALPQTPNYGGGGFARPGPLTGVLPYTQFGPEFRHCQSLAHNAVMASLLPLLHDLLPMIIPSEVRVVRCGELALVEERAERPPWYPQQIPVAKGPPDAPLSSWTGGDGDTWKSGPSGSESEKFEPIQLLDLDPEDQHRAAAITTGTQHGASVDPPPQRDGQTPAPSPQTSGPKVFRHDALVGVTDKMCITGKPTSV